MPNSMKNPAGLSRTLVFTATYNEIGSVEEFCRRVLSLESGPDFLVVDDNSSDGTGRFLEKLALGEPRLKIIHRPRKLGLGSAHKLAFLYALKRGYEFLVTMDADLSHNPDEIPNLITAVNGADFVIGSRYMKGGSCDYHGYRKFLSLFANNLARLLLGIPLHEYTSSFRVFRTAIFDEIDVGKIGGQGYSFFLKSVWHIYVGGYRCSEVPSHFADRMHGESKIPRYEVIYGLLNLAELLLRRVLGRRQVGRASGTVANDCYFCGSDLVVEQYSRRGEPNLKASGVQCTSMAHRSKPQVVHCLVCGLLAAGNNGAPTDLERLYEDVVDETYLQNRAARQKTFSVNFDAIAPDLPPTGRMLEVGAYCGFFMDVARERGWQVEGIEPSHWAATYGQEQLGLDIHQGTLERLEGRLDGGYEVAVMWDVLEHLPDPMSALRRIHCLLDDDGLLCLSTLDIDSWFPRLMGANWPWIMDMHLFYFSRGVLEDMFAKAGFDLINTRVYRHYASAPYFLEKLAFLLPAPLGRIARFLSFLALRRILIPFHFGDIKLFVCRKMPSQ